MKTVFVVGLFPDRNRTFLQHLCRNFRVIMLKGQGGWVPPGCSVEFAEDIIGSKELALSHDDFFFELHRYMQQVEGHLSTLFEGEEGFQIRREHFPALQQSAAAAAALANVCRRLLKRVPVDMVITNADSSCYRRPAVLEARLAGVPSLSIGHGFLARSPEPVAHRPEALPEFPYISDYVNLDNHLEKDLLEKTYQAAGIADRVELVVHGTPNDVTSDESVTRAVATHALGLDPERFTVTVAGSWLFAVGPSVLFTEIVEEGEFYETVFGALGRAPEGDRCQLLVKLHPALVSPPILQDVTSYLQGLAARSGVKKMLIAADRLPLVLAASDLIISPSYSSTLWEAFMTWVPGLVYPSSAALQNVLVKDRLNSSNPLYRAGLLRHVFSPQEFMEAVRHYMQPANRAEYVSSSRQFRQEWQIESTSPEEKSRRLCEWIAQLLDGRHPQSLEEGHAAASQTPQPPAAAARVPQQPSPSPRAASQTKSAPTPKTSAAGRNGSSTPPLTTPDGGALVDRGSAPSASCTPGYYEHARPEIRNLVPATARHVLDVGCGRGELGKALKARQSCEVTGIEYLPEAARDAERALDRVLAGDVAQIAPSLPRQHYDCIVMADVLEHLQDPGEVLLALRATLAAGGRFVISVPNVRHWSVVRGLLEGQWGYQEAGILDRTHLRFFTRSSFESIMREAGLKATLAGTTSVQTQAIPSPVVEALRSAGLHTASLEQETNAYQFLYVAEPMPAATEHPLVSIVVLTHNQLQHTRACLESIERNTRGPYELILVDNASTDGTVDYFRGYISTRGNVRVVANRSNLGFAAGNNLGLALARGEYLLLLNNDTLVTVGWLERMLAVFQRYPRTGIVGPMGFYVSGAQMVPNPPYTNMAELESFAARWSVDHEGQAVSTVRVVGFCLLARRMVVEALGGLDQRYGSGNFEDDDLCLRAAQAGFEARIAKDVFIHHVGGQTFKGAGIDYAASLHRNWAIFKAKWGIPADTPYEQGYRLPLRLQDPTQLNAPLPQVMSSHRGDPDGRWWEEIADSTGQTLPPRTASEDPGRLSAIAGAAPVPIAPLTTLVLSHGTAIDSFWATLIERTLVPLSLTLLRSEGGAGSGAHAMALSLPAGWQLRVSDTSWHDAFTKAIGEAQGNPVLLLSDDVVVTPGWLDTLQTHLLGDSRLLAVGPTSNLAPKPQRVRPTYTGTGREMRRFVERRAAKQAGQRVEAPYLGLFCLLASSPLARSLEPLQGDLPWHDAFLDFFNRAGESGMGLAVALDSFVHHQELSIIEGANFQDEAVAREQYDREFSLAKATMEGGDLERAVEQFASLAERYPNESPSFSALGAAFAALDRAPEAVTALTRAAELCPKDAEIHNQLGVALYRAGDVDRAEATLGKASVLAPETVQPILNLVELYRELGNYDQAAATIKRALSVDSGNPEVLTAFGVLCLELGDAEGARLAATKLQAAAPDHPAVTALFEALSEATASQGESL